MIYSHSDHVPSLKRFNLQRPDLWTTEELGRGEWMTNGDVEKLRKMYECDGRKFILFERELSLLSRAPRRE